jgi:hypothetical protein
MKRICTGFLLALIALPTVAFEPQSPLPNALGASELSREQHPRFVALDKDRDGYISRAEALHDSNLATEFINVDESQDDRLNEKEFAKFALRELSIPVGGTEGESAKFEIDVKPASPPVGAVPDIGP